ncbi:FG-GAP repeat protein [Nonomuraea sp. NBC_01738]|uniref:FG-GAP repeat protein n=1 Tax=Nonomuraea sp. NBC_01738 TaxID=2976003 RepID=UPI002E15660F|nr:FG-GAP repeat protein [Nonomuraea sp. NBC_01738]
MKPVAAAVSLLLLAACTPAADEPRVADCAHAGARDVDGDGLDDLVAGDTESWKGGTGAVYLLTSGRLVPLPLPDKRALGLGAAVSLTRVDGDGCADVIVSAPDTEVDGLPGAGAVYILYGGAARPPTRLVAPKPQAGAAFGESLAAYGETLAIGAPHQNVAGATAAGAVYLARNGSIESTITQDSPGIPGNSEELDRFGTSIALGPDVLVVGTPFERRDGAGRQRPGSRVNPQSGAVTVVRDLWSAPPKGTRLTSPTDCRNFGNSVAYAEKSGFAVAGCGQVKLYNPAGKPSKTLRTRKRADPTMVAAHTGGFATMWSDSSLQLGDATPMPWKQGDPWSMAVTPTLVAIGLPTSRPGGAIAVLDPKTGRIKTYRADKSTQLGDSIAA